MNDIIETAAPNGHVLDRSSALRPEEASYLTLFRYKLTELDDKNRLQARQKTKKDRAEALLGAGLVLASTCLVFTAYLMWSNRAVSQNPPWDAVAELGYTFIAVLWGVNGIGKIYNTGRPRHDDYA